MSETDTGKNLKRVIGVPGLVATIINFSIGGSIFAFPAIIGLQLGGASVLGYVLCGIMFAAIMLCYVEIGSRIKTTGGSYAYVEHAFGPFAGYIINWLFFFGWGIISDAAVMNIIADSLSLVFPIFSDKWVRILLFVILTGLMILVNIFDSKTSVRFVSVFTVVKLLPLLAIIILGVRLIDGHYFLVKSLPSLSDFDSSALILFFAFAGFETSLNVSGEIKDPARTVPRSVLIGGICVFVVLVLIQVITQSILGVQLADYKVAPLAEVASRLVGPVGAIVLLFAAAFSALGSVNGDVFASSRLLFAGAKDGLFPKYLARVHPKFVTPHLAIITYAGLILFFSVIGGFKQLAILASGALLIIYLAVVLALIKLRLSKNQFSENGFTIPGGLIVPVFAVITILYVFSNLSLNEIISLGAFIAFTCLIYFIVVKGRLKN